MYKFYKWRLLHPTAEGGYTAADPDDTAAAADDAKEEGTEDPLNDGDGRDEGEVGDTVTMSQDDFDTAIAKAEKRGERKARSKASPPAGDADGNDDTAKVADARMQAANAKMLAATIKTIGTDLEITGNGLTVATRMIDTSDCFDEAGDVDEDAVRDALEAFLADYPEFRKAAEKKPAFQAQGNPRSVKTTTEQAKKDALGVK